LFGKRKLEVVPEGQYTDFSERLKAEGNKYATKKTVIAALVPLAVAVPIVVNKMSSSAETFTTTTLPVAAAIQPPPPIPTPQPTLDILAQSPSYIPVNTTSEVIQTGFIADKSLEGIANVMDPLIQILVEISLPVASVIMVGACFFFMFGNSEKAWSMIMNAGLGYVLIQLSTLFLNMLRTVGEAV
jgi:hypothetical protein